jgi:imidazolonepropionase-like amidohydrolase
MRHYSFRNLALLQPEQERWVAGSLTVLGDRFTNLATRARDCIDCSGLFAIPGLIDVHVHMFGEAGISKAAEFSWAEDEESAFARGLANASEFLRFGVTSVRDLGGYSARCFKFQRRIRSEFLTAPRFYTAGQFITTSERSDHWFGRIADPGTLAETVADICAAGADWVKIINDPIDFDEEVLSKAIRVARQSGIPVSIHAYSEEATVIAMNAGADSIEHSAVGWNSVLNHPRLGDVYFVPTVVCSEDVVFDPLGSLIKDETLLKTFCEWNCEQHQYLPAAIKAKARIAVGSDAGFPPTVPGLSLHREMELLWKLGCDPLSVLRRATELNAALLGSPSIGSLSAGNYADFVLIDGDTITIGEFWRSIVSVFVGGRCVYGTDLRIHE